MWIYKKQIALYSCSFAISKKALSLIKNESRQRFPDETGGILAGWHDQGRLRIEVAIGPGPRAIHKRNNFCRDGSYTQEQLDLVVSRSMGKWDYLGEWHSHPQKIGPSGRDIASLRKIASNPAYAIDDPILGLSILENDSWVFYCYSLNKPSISPDKL